MLYQVELSNFIIVFASSAEEAKKIALKAPKDGEEVVVVQDLNRLDGGWDDRCIPYGELPINYDTIGSLIQAGYAPNYKRIE